LREQSFPDYSLKGHAPQNRNSPLQPRQQRAGSGHVNNLNNRRNIARYVLAVALTVVGLAVGYVIFGVDGPGDNKRLTVPGAVAPSATPTPAQYTDQLLFTFTIPADQLPRGEGIGAGLAYSSIPSGNHSSWKPTCCDGVLIQHVIAGSYTVIAQSIITVARANGMIEEIPAREEVTLGAGDTLISRNEVEYEAINRGEIPVRLLHWVGIEKGNFNGHYLPGWVNGAVDGQAFPENVYGPATLRLHRIELLGKASFPAPAAGTLVYAISQDENAAGTPIAGRIVKLGDGELVSVGDEPGVAYLLTFDQDAIENGSPVAATLTPSANSI